MYEGGYCKMTPIDTRGRGGGPKLTKNLTGFFKSSLTLNFFVFFLIFRGRSGRVGQQCLGAVPKTLTNRPGQYFS